MEDAMDLITATVCALAGFGVGYGTHKLIVGNVRQKYRDIIAAKDRRIIATDQHVSDLTGELVQTSDRNSDLRLELTDTERKLGRAQAEIMSLKDDAELGRRVKAQRQTALAKAQAANRARFHTNGSGSGAGAAATVRG
jgi:septal ring factor EnvC (AmiA/AmiB activator)